MSKFQYADQVIEGEWRGTRDPIICGVRFPINLFHANFEKDFPHFRTRNDDVFVVTYPKSGTTWVQEIVWQLYHTGQASTEQINNRVPCFDFSKLLDTKGTEDEQQALENRPSPRLLKSHLPYHLIPKGETEATKCKYIYVSRNPKDVAVSLYHFISGFGEEVFRGPWEFFVRTFLAGKVSYGLWSDHVLGWWEHKGDPNILFLQYEDMHKNLEDNVRKIANFLEKPVSQEVVKRVAEQCTFQSMSKNKEAYQEGPSTRIRKGKVGDWKNYFTPELNARFENELLAKLEGTGIQFDYE